MNPLAFSLKLQYISLHQVRLGNQGEDHASSSITFRFADRRAEAASTYKRLKSKVSN